MMSWVSTSSGAILIEQKRTANSLLDHLQFISEPRMEGFLWKNPIRACPTNIQDDADDGQPLRFAQSLRFLETK